MEAFSYISMVEKLIELLTSQQEEHREQLHVHRVQVEKQQDENSRLIELLMKGQADAAAKPAASMSLPNFPGF